MNQQIFEVSERCREGDEVYHEVSLFGWKLDIECLELPVHNLKHTVVQFGLLMFDSVQTLEDWLNDNAAILIALSIEGPDLGQACYALKDAERLEENSNLRSPLRGEDNTIPVIKDLVWSNEEK